MADQGKIKIEAWPAAGGGLLLATTIKSFAQTCSAVSRASPNFFLIFECEKAAKLIIPYVKLERDAWQGVQQLLERRLRLQHGSLEIHDIGSRPGTEEAHSNLVLGVAPGDWLDARLQEMSRIFHHLIVSAAANRWDVPPESCTVHSGHIFQHSLRLKEPFDHFYHMAACEIDRSR